MVRRVDPNALIWCRKCSGYARCRLGPKTDKPLQARKDGHERVWDDVENKTQIRRRKGDRKEKGWKVEGEKRTVTRKECKRLREEVEVGGFMA